LRKYPEKADLIEDRYTKKDTAKEPSEAAARALVENQTSAAEKDEDIFSTRAAAQEAANDAEQSNNPPAQRSASEQVQAWAEGQGIDEFSATREMEGGFRVTYQKEGEQQTTNLALTEEAEQQFEDRQRQQQEQRDALLDAAGKQLDAALGAADAPITQSAPGIEISRTETRTRQDGPEQTSSAAEQAVNDAGSALQNTLSDAVSAVDESTTLDEKASAAVNAVNSGVDQVSDTASDVVDTVDDSTTIDEQVTAAVNNPVATATDAASDVGNVVNSGVDQVSDTASDVVDTVDDSTTIDEQAANAVNGPFNTATDAASDVDNAVDAWRRGDLSTTGVLDAIDNPVDTASDAASDAVSAVDSSTTIDEQASSAVNDGLGAVSDTASDVGNAVNSGVAAVADTSVADVAQGVSDAGRSRVESVEGRQQANEAAADQVDSYVNDLADSSTEQSVSSSLSNQERFGNIDWSMGFGGPGDEVEQTVDSTAQSTRMKLNGAVGDLSGTPMLPTTAATQALVTGDPGKVTTGSKVQQGALDTTAGAINVPAYLSTGMETAELGKFLGAPAVNTVANTAVGDEQEASEAADTTGRRAGATAATGAALAVSSTEWAINHPQRALGSGIATGGLAGLGYGVSSYAGLGRYTPVRVERASLPDGDGTTTWRGITTNLPGRNPKPKAGFTDYRPTLGTPDVDLRGPEKAPNTRGIAPESGIETSIWDANLRDQLDGQNLKRYEAGRELADRLGERGISDTAKDRFTGATDANAEEGIRQANQIPDEAASEVADWIKQDDSILGGSVSQLLHTGKARTPDDIDIYTSNPNNAQKELYDILDKHEDRPVRRDDRGTGIEVYTEDDGWDHMVDINKRSRASGQKDWAGDLHSPTMAADGVKIQPIESQINSKLEGAMRLYGDDTIAPVTWRSKDAYDVGTIADRLADQQSQSWNPLTRLRARGTRDAADAWRDTFGDLSLPGEEYGSWAGLEDEFDSTTLGHSPEGTGAGETTLGPRPPVTSSIAEAAENTVNRIIDVNSHNQLGEAGDGIDTGTARSTLDSGDGGLNSDVESSLYPDSDGDQTPQYASENDANYLSGIADDYPEAGPLGDSNGGYGSAYTQTGDDGGYAPLYTPPGDDGGGGTYEPPYTPPGDDGRGGTYEPPYTPPGDDGGGSTYEPPYTPPGDDGGGSTY
ncbi:hypothetical protein, partial [Halarchaeum salinum]|uniref:hypothetical protein n=1 Tax=Halarchaeum salinum TaxID=489912 RepID=UPI0031E301FC